MVYMNILEYKEAIDLIKNDNVKTTLRKSVNTFKHFCSFKKTVDILYVYFNLDDFDKWLSIKSLVNQRNAYNHIYQALFHIDEIRTNMDNIDTLLSFINQKKQNVIDKINEPKQSSENDSEDLSEEDYIKYLEDKVNVLESKLDKCMQLSDIFVYDKYRKVFDIILN